MDNEDGNVFIWKLAPWFRGSEEHHGFEGVKGTMVLKE